MVAAHDHFPDLLLEILVGMLEWLGLYPELPQQVGLKLGINVHPSGEPQPVYHVSCQRHHASFRAGVLAGAPCRIRACVMR